MTYRFQPFADGMGGIHIWDTDLPPVEAKPKPVHEMTVKELERAVKAAPTAMDAAILEERWGWAFDQKD